MSHHDPSAESPPGDHLDRLIHAHLDDSLSADGLAELEGLLLDSAAARARFWELAEVEGLGRDAARLAWGDHQSPLPGQLRPTNVLRRAVAVAGIVLAGLAALLVIARPGDLDQAKDAAAVAVKSGPALPPPLATVTSTRFLLTAEEVPPLPIGQPLDAGRISLLGGAVELTLRNGVVIILEGPGTLDLRGEMEAFLVAGSALVRMPEGASGFRLDTATTEVLDLGTEFAVSIGPGFATDVQVFDGAVVASSKTAGDGGLLPRRLEAGQAARFSPDAAGEPQPIPYATSRFVRRLPPDTGIPVKVSYDNPAWFRRLFGRPRHDCVTVSRAREPVTVDGRLDEWQLAPGFRSSLDGTDACPEWADGRMMYDDEHLYIAAHVGDPAPLQSSIDPAVDPDLGWRGGSVQVRVSTDREMGWPAAGNTSSYYGQRKSAPTAAEKAAAENPRLAHLTMWFHAASQTPCLTIRRGALVSELEVNPSFGQPGGYRGAFTRDADGKGYVLEYAIPWRLLRCEDDPPRPGDVLAAVWQIHWSDEAGRLQREHMVEIRNPHEPIRINVWERAATWGRAEYQP